MLLATRLSINKELLVVEEHGTLYVIPPLAAPIRLNFAASEIWRLVSSDLVLDEVVNAYQLALKCSSDVAQLEVLAFVEAMLRSGFFLKGKCNDDND